MTTFIGRPGVADSNRLRLESATPGRFETQAVRMVGEIDDVLGQTCFAHVPASRIERSI